jgi:hypothetical protein
LFKSLRVRSGRRPDTATSTAIRKIGEGRLTKEKVAPKITHRRETVIE